VLARSVWLPGGSTTSAEPAERSQVSYTSHLIVSSWVGPDRGPRGRCMQVAPQAHGISSPVESRGQVARVSVTDEAIEKIKAMIMSGDLRPGERLPVEDKLAARLGISRSSLREAVRALALVHILDVRQGDGTYVTSLRPELLLDAVSFVIDFHRDDSVLHFLEVRRIVEHAATASAAMFATPEDIERLDNVLAKVTPDSNAQHFIDLDREFHREVVAICRNPVLVSLLDTISGPTHRGAGLARGHGLGRPPAHAAGATAESWTPSPGISRTWPPRGRQHTLRDSRTGYAWRACTKYPKTRRPCRLSCGSPAPRRCRRHRLRPWWRLRRPRR